METYLTRVIARARRSCSDDDITDAERKRNTGKEKEALREKHGKVEVWKK